MVQIISKNQILFSIDVVVDKNVVIIIFIKLCLGMIEIDASKISDPLWRDLAEFVKQRGGGDKDSKEAAPVWMGIEAPPGAATSIKNEDAWLGLLDEGNASLFNTSYFQIIVFHHMMST